MLITFALPAALNSTKAFCGEPVRDLTHITPIVTAVSGTFAIAAVVMRLVDSLARDTFLNWSNFSIVVSLVRIPKLWFFGFFLTWAQS